MGHTCRAVAARPSVVFSSTTVAAARFGVSHAHHHSSPCHQAPPAAGVPPGPCALEEGRRCRSQAHGTAIRAGEHDRFRVEPVPLFVLMAFRWSCEEAKICALLRQRQHSSHLSCIACPKQTRLFPWARSLQFHECPNKPACERPLPTSSVGDNRNRSKLWAYQHQTRFILDTHALPDVDVYEHVRFGTSRMYSSSTYGCYLFKRCRRFMATTVLTLARRILIYPSEWIERLQACPLIPGPYRWHCV